MYPVSLNFMDASMYSLKHNTEFYFSVIIIFIFKLNLNLINMLTPDILNNINKSIDNQKGKQIQESKQTQFKKSNNQTSPSKDNSSNANSRINENQNKPRPSSKFKVADYCATTRLTTLSQDQQLKSLYDLYRVLNPIDIANADPTGEKISISNIIHAAESIFEKYIVPSILANTAKLNNNPESSSDKGNPNLNSNIAACLLRIQRFRLKWTTLYLLYQLPNIPNLGVQKQFEKITESLINRKIHFNLTNPNKDKQVGPVISVESTINLINKELTNAEFKLKSLMPAIASSLGIVAIDPSLGVDASTFNALNHIAPEGFTDSQDDYYYICRLLLIKPELLPFSTEKVTSSSGKVTYPQKPQWESYYKEFLQLFPFYWSRELTINFDLLIEKGKGNIINLPFQTFIKQKSFSTNTFGRIISASNNFMFNAWFTLALAIAERHERKALIKAPSKTE